VAAPAILESRQPWHCHQDLVLPGIFPLLQLCPPLNSAHPSRPPTATHAKSRHPATLGLLQGKNSFL